MINKKVLIIDDYISELEHSLEVPLKELGFKVEKTADPNQGIRLASSVEEALYGTIFIDFRYENFSIDGAYVCKELKKKSPYSTLIFLSGVGEDYWTKIATAGADGCINKEDLELKMSSTLPDFINQEINIAFNNKLNGKDFILLKELRSGLHQNLIKSRIELLNSINDICEKKEKDDLGLTPITSKYISIRLTDDFKKTRKGNVKDFSEANVKKHFSTTIQSMSNVRNVIRTLFVLQENSGKWKYAKNHFVQLKKFIKYFDIEP